MKYLHLVVGKNYCEEEVIFFVAGMSETLFLKFGTRPRGAGGAVMAVGDVEKRHLAKGLHEAHRIGNMPDGVLNTIRGGEVENGICHCRFHRHCIDVASRPVSEEYGPGLGAQHQQVMSAIILFITASSLVFTNQILVILIY